MEETDIQKCYNNQTVFVTGGTGFLGKQIVFKLLYSCPSIKKIYLLIRDKKGQSAEERLNLFLDSFCFQKLKIQTPDFKSKVGVIKGDCVLPQLGMSEEDQNVLKKEVNFIFHVSATVRFDEKIRLAGYINVRAIQDLLTLAKEIEDLKAFVHVSTAYSNCNRKGDIGEKFYEPPLNADQLLTLLDKLDDDTLDRMTDSLRGDWPNTYTFTKAISEDVVREGGAGLPIAVARPSIVLVPVNEPIPGYFDIVQGITGICLGIYVGVVRALFISNHNITRIVPSDYAANNILAAAWNVARERPTDIPIYNFVGSKKKPITWGFYIAVALKAARATPTMAALWWPFLITTDNRVLFTIYRFLLHQLPAMLVDLVRKLSGKKTKAVKIYKKIEVGSEQLNHFTLNMWNFDITNVETLWERMSEKDKDIFQFNMDDLDWLKYMSDGVRSTREHLIKDPISTLPNAKRKQVLFKLVHYFIIWLMIYLLYKLICVLFRF